MYVNYDYNDNFAKLIIIMLYHIYLSFVLFIYVHGIENKARKQF